MTPANDPNGKPFIYRIADALGITHLVVAVQHSHTMSEVTDLPSITNTPSYGSSSLITSGGVHTALQGKADKNKISDTASNGAYAMVEAETDNKGQITFGLKDAGDSSTDYTSLNKDNVDNFKRALRNPDTTPTADSDNLVTSGGVKAALDGKQDALTFDTTPTANSTNPVTSGGVKAAIDDATKAVFGSMPYYITAAHEKMHVHTRILRNNTGATIKLTECIDVTALPAAERANIYWNTPDIDIPNDTEIGIRFVRASNAVFLYYDGNFDY